jgi:hypothetical protein
MLAVILQLSPIQLLSRCIDILLRCRACIVILPKASQLKISLITERRTTCYAGSRKYKKTMPFSQNLISQDCLSKSFELPFFRFASLQTDPIDPKHILSVSWRSIFCASLRSELFLDTLMFRSAVDSPKVDFLNKDRDILAEKVKYTRPSNSAWKEDGDSDSECDWQTQLGQAVLMLDAYSIADRGQLNSDDDMVEMEPNTAPSTGTFVISTRAPHKIMSATEELCSLLGFTAADMAQRSIRLLYGPETDSTAITSAVKRMLLAFDDHYTAVVPTFTVYSSSGAPHVVRVVCSRLPPRGAGGTDEEAACRLQLSWAPPPSAEPSTTTPSPHPRPVLPACLWSAV